MSATFEVSIIVPCLNPGSGLRDALQSVWNQEGSRPQLIVVDGGSTDGTREWLGNAQGRIHTLIMEPDRGIYDAMNKGLFAACGRWVYFLGADDRLAATRVLADALDWLQRTDAGIVGGEARYHDGRIYRLRPHFNPRARNFIHHQAAFYRRSLFQENGAFDPSLRIAADYDFNLRLWLARVRFEPIPLRIAACGVGGASDGGAWRVYREEIAVRHRYFPAWRCVGWDALSLLRYARKRCVR